MRYLEPVGDLLTAHPRWSALACGAIAATGFAPLSLWPVALLAMAGLVWLTVASANWKEAGLRGWLFGVAHFSVANNWIATAFTFQADMPVWLGWLAVPLLALYLAIYPALACIATRLLVRRNFYFAYALALAGCWAIAEWLRSWVFSGFAWDPFGAILLGGFDRPGLAMVLPWFGTYALSALAVLAAGLGLAAVLARKPIRFALLALLLTAGMYWPTGERKEGSLAFTLVQPFIPQPEIDDPTKFEEHFVRTASLSRKQRENDRRLVLWPESGVPDYLRDGYPQRYYLRMTAGGDPEFARFRIGNAVGEGGLLLTGAVDLEIRDGTVYGARNAVTAITNRGRIVAGYDKAHLVPFGEYVPLRALLEPLGMTRLVAGAIDFLPGPGPQTLELGDWGRAGIQICYEIVFSGEVVERGKRPDYIFNPSNDGWFGDWGPPQHLAQARLRAIEEGLPVLRSTTTGISAVIDADGIVRDHIGRNRASRIDGYVPPAAPPTLFAKLGNRLALGWAVAFIIMSLVATRLKAS